MDAATGFCACPCCGLVHALGADRSGSWRCARCAHPLPVGGRGRGVLRWTAACAMAGLVVYPAAILLPVLSIERLGHRHEAGILDGALALVAHGQILVGTVVLLTSVVLPALKLGLLLTLGLAGPRLAPRMRAGAWRLVELTGRWGMLDVLLVAVLVAVVKLGDLAEVHAGVGALCFTALVVLNLIASLLFEPQALWEEEA